MTFPPGTMVTAKFDMGKDVYAGEVYTVKRSVPMVPTPAVIMLLEELGDKTLCFAHEFEPVPYKYAFTAVDEYCSWWKRECYQMR